MSVFEEIYTTLTERRKEYEELRTKPDQLAERIDKSYTLSLFKKGAEKINRKIMEEAFEVTQTTNGMSDHSKKNELVHEGIDLIYHLFTQLAYQGISFHELEDELRRRIGVSGIEEKNNRTK